MALLLVLVAWALFGFAGAYRWTVIPLAAGAALLALVAPPRLGGPHRTADMALVIGLLVAALQLVPMSPALRATISPGAVALERTVRLAPLDPAVDGARPLSIDPEAGTWALLLGATLLLIFWCARTVFERAPGLRQLARALAWYGIVLGAVVFVQRALSPGLIYGFWRPIARIDDPNPIGPFLNRNDLAAWLILAFPLVLGYAIARIDAHVRRDLRPLVLSMVEPRSITLAVSLCLMLAALLASLSRSGLVGAAIGVATVMAVGARRLGPAGLTGLAATVGLLATAATAYASLPALAERVGSLTSSLSGGRTTIWQETWPMVVDFPLIGIGVGAFERGMSVYQQSTRLLFFNHAHNEYLQVLVEGGPVLVAAMLVALLAGAREIAQRLGTDTTPLFFLRAGAAGAVAALTVQSVWHVGARMPATGVLFAVAAAIAVHRPEGAAAIDEPVGEHRWRPSPSAP